MLPKSRLVLIGLGCSLAIAAWLARSPNVPAAPQPATAVAGAGASGAAVPMPGVPGRQETVGETASSQTVATAARPLTFGGPGSTRLEDVPAGRFRRDLERLAPDAQRRALAQLGNLRVPRNDVTSLRADRNGRLYYECPPPFAAQMEAVRAAADQEMEMAAEAAPTRRAAASPIGSPPIHHSRAGATKVIYLDFNGHTVTGTAWNEAMGEPGDADYSPAVATYEAKPFDTDEDATTFSDYEQNYIDEIWARVAEDFLPFDVDVTTEAPAIFTSQVIHVVITATHDQNGVAMPGSATAAGISFLDVFGDPDFAHYSPVFVYGDALYGNSSSIAEAASHEAGHYLSLSHDGTSSAEYYTGHGTGYTSWAPIMGAGYYVSMTQWSKGEYYDANNHQDDLALLAERLGYIYPGEPDDRADSNGAATPLTVDGANYSGNGVIARTGDADRFSFTTGAGQLDLTVRSLLPATGNYGTNLDIALELYDSAGALVATGDDPYTTNQILSTAVTGGTYYLRVRGTGTQTPLANPPSGYTEYGSLGAYEISGSTLPPQAPSFGPFGTSKTVTAGAGFDLNVYAYGTPWPTHRWERLPVGTSTWVAMVDDSVYQGTQTNNLQVPVATLAMNGDQFRCVATNLAGTATSNPILLTVVPAVPPSFSTQPANAQIKVGNSAQFLSSAGGSLPISYQWQRLAAGSADWVNVVPGGPYNPSFGGSLSISPVSLAMHGDQFRCIATNLAGSATSQVATLTIIPLEPPTITYQPWLSYPTIVVAGTQNIHLSAQGEWPISYQWQRLAQGTSQWVDLVDGGDYSGARNSGLTVIASSLAVNGDQFRCVVSNAAGSVISNAVTLVVAAQTVPVVSVQLPGIVEATQDSVALSVQIENPDGVSYQWYHEGMPVPNSNSRFLNLANATKTDAGDYYVVATNQAGSATSSVISVVPSKGQLPQIGALFPDTITAYPFSGGLSVNSQTAGQGSMTYQWYKDGVAIPGANNYFYSKPDATAADAGLYMVEITNAAGTVRSQEVVRNWSDFYTTTAWNDYGRVGDVVYFFERAAARIRRYDLATETWLPDTTLTAGWMPSEFLATPEGIFIAYYLESDWSTGFLARRSLDLQAEVMAKDAVPRQSFLFQIGDLLYYSGLRTLNKGTFAAGPTSSAPGIDFWDNILEGSKPVYSASAKKLLSARARVQVNAVAADGSLVPNLQEGVSPPYPINRRAWLSPDGTIFWSETGNGFSVDDLHYIGSFGLPVSDLAFLPGGAPIVLHGDLLAKQDGAGYTETARYRLGKPGRIVQQKGDALFVFSNPTAAGGVPGVEKVALSALQPATPAAPAEPVGERFVIDDAFIDAHGVVHLLDRLNGQLLRWDAVAGAFQATIALRGRPNAMSYAPAIDRAVFAYADGVLTDVFPSSAPTEQAFGNLPGGIPLLALVAMDEFAAVDSGRRMVVDPEGAAAFVSGGTYSAALQAWNSTHRRLYYTHAYFDDSLDWAQISSTGAIGPGAIGPNASRVPLRIQPEGELILAAGRNIFSGELQPLAQLRNSVTDGTWLGNTLFTIRPRVDGTQVQKWTAGSYAVAGTVTVPGAPKRIFRRDATTVVVVSLVDGYLAFTNVSDALVAGATSVNNGMTARPELFNADAYLANNPDVAALIGNVPDKAQKSWEHYLNYGIGEGRTDGDFNVQAYLAQYPDLATQFGTDLKAAALHWYTTGRKNGLRIPAGFDVLGYLARNSDIAALFSQDKYGAWLHYYNYGLFEGRSFDANFIPAEYLELNQDLKTVFGSNLQAAVMHWFNYGHPLEDRMGRVPIGFNVDSYLARYPDLSAVFAGITPIAVRNVTVWHHYLAYGTLEGRSDGDFEAYHYLATNPDLNAIFGTDIQAAALHWYFYGRREGRRIPGGFNVQNYRALYPDIVLVFGDDLYGSWIHYRDNGVFEGRVYDDLFRPVDYLTLNPDVAAIVGNNYSAALLHWLYYGQYEGRQARF